MTRKNKTLLIIGAGLAQLHAFKLAREMGYHIVATDMYSNAPGFKLADDALIANTYDLEESLQVVLDYQKQKPIDGVISVGVDNPIVVATLADRLGLPTIPIESAKLGSDKYKMKVRFTEDGIPVPRYKKILSLSDLQQYVKESKDEIVLKPTDSRGARGILKLSDNIDIEWAFKYSKHISPSGILLVEEFIQGPQLSTESIVYKGKAYTVAYSDRNYEYIERFSPFIIENGGTMPSTIENNIKEEISNLINRIAISLGIENGVIKGDLVLSNKGIKVIEIATRLSGGFFCTDQVILSTGVDLVQAAIKISLGEELDVTELNPKYHRHIDKKYFFLPEGQIKEINFDEDITEYEWVERFDLFVNEGDIVEAITDHTKRSGVVICSGDTRSEAIERSRSVIDSVKFRIEK